MIIKDLCQLGSHPFNLFRMSKHFIYTCMSRDTCKHVQFFSSSYNMYVYIAGAEFDGEERAYCINVGK